MIIRNVGSAGLIDAAEAVGQIRVEIEDRSNSRTDQFRVRLFPVGDARRTYNPIDGRRKNAVSWAGHRDFFREVFARFPKATIKTTMATYRGAEEFEATYDKTGEQSVVGPYYGYVPYKETGE